MVSAEGRRLLRSLGQSGRRLRRSGTGWRLYLGDDKRRRSLLRPDDALVAELAATGYIVPDGEDAYRASGKEFALRDVDVTAIALPEPVVRHYSGGSGFAGMVRRAARGEGPLNSGQARAGLRLQADIELSQTGSLASMSWVAEPGNNGRIGQSRGGLPPAGRAAARRLELLRQFVSDGDLQIAGAACVGNVSLKALEQKFRLPARSGARILSEVLERVRDAYDRHIGGGVSADICL